MSASPGRAPSPSPSRKFSPSAARRSPCSPIGGAFVDDQGSIEIGYAIVESQRSRGYATASVEVLATKARAAPEVRRILAHTPLERPQSGRVLEKAGFSMVREMDDADEAGNVLRVEEWELLV